MARSRYLVVAQAEYYTYVDADDEKDALRIANGFKDGKDDVVWHRTMKQPLTDISVIDVAEPDPYGMMEKR